MVTLVPLAAGLIRGVWETMMSLGVWQVLHWVSSAWAPPEWEMMEPP